MLNEAEITEQTGITYLRGNVNNPPGIPFANTVNLLNPIFSSTGTGEETRPRFRRSILPALYRVLPSCRLLATPTGCELNDVDIVVVVAASCGQGVTDYHVNFEIKNSSYMNIPTKHLEKVTPAVRNTATIEAERLKEISGLTVERLAEIFGVSRTTYYNWSTGSPLHNTHRNHLLEVLPLLEEANQRLGSSGTTNTWLLTPVSPGGKKPIDYLAEREYSTFRGFLLRVRNGQEIFKSLRPSKRVYIERSIEETEDARERLRRRVWRDKGDAQKDI